MGKRQKAQDEAPRQEGAKAQDEAPPSQPEPPAAQQAAQQTDYTGKVETVPAPAAPAPVAPPPRRRRNVLKQRPPAERAARFASRLRRQAAELYPEPVKEPTPAEMMAEIRDLKKRLDERG